MTTFTVDDSELRRVAVLVAQIPLRAEQQGRPILQKGALNIKNGLRDQAMGHPTFPAFPSSITYETKVLARGIEAEIGPDKGRPQGALGNILYFGTSKNAPVLDLEAPMREEEPRFVKALGLMADDLLGA